MISRFKEAACMHFGVDYYPEHWDEGRWYEDLKLMKELRFNTVRVAEFAWCRLEPKPDEYDFSWLDRFLKAAETEGFKVMLGVPARNIPAWLSASDPETAIQAYEGHRESFGTRYTTCLNNSYLRDRALRLAERMAQHYKASEVIHSWHLDNELGDASPCYCPACRKQFIGWLKDKYKSCSALNEAWGLVFWSLEISDWDQIWLPTRTNHFAHNPSLLLDYRRFTSRVTEAFAEEQAGIIRENCPGAIITTNLQSTTRFHTDYYKLSESLDFVSTNYYPPESYNTVDLDRLRSLKKGPFWVVEQKSAAPDRKVREGSRLQTSYGFLTPQPGETRLNTYQSISRGADMVLYFRMRPCLFGQEQFHGGILNYDGGTGRIFDEIKKTGLEIEKIRPYIDGTKVESQVALLYSYESRWAMESYPPGIEMDYRTVFLDYHREFERLHVATDIVSPESDLSAYSLVVAPLLYVMNPGIVENLVSYTEAGGVLLLTARSGLKDEHGNIIPEILPPALSELCGISIVEGFPLRPEQKAGILEEEGDEYEVSRWIELLDPKNGCTVRARYKDSWYAGQAAVTEMRSGEGLACFIGSVPEARFIRNELRRLLKFADINVPMNAPSDVYISVRNGNGRNVVFCLNPNSTMRRISLPPGTVMKDLIQGVKIQGELELAPLDVALLIEE